MKTKPLQKNMDNEESQIKTDKLRLKIHDILHMNPYSATENSGCKEKIDAIQSLLEEARKEWSEDELKIRVLIRKQVRQEARKQIIEEIREYTEENRWWVMDESREAIELNPFLFFLDSLDNFEWKGFKK